MTRILYVVPFALAAFGCSDSADEDATDTSPLGDFCFLGDEAAMGFNSYALVEFGGLLAKYCVKSSTEYDPTMPPLNTVCEKTGTDPTTDCGNGRQTRSLTSLFAPLSPP